MKTLLLLLALLLPLAAWADDSVPPSAGAGGAPSGPAGGALGGTYPSPSVDDDGHNHTSATAPGEDLPVYTVTCATSPCTGAEVQTAIDAICDPPTDTKGGVLLLPEDTVNVANEIVIGGGGNCYGLHMWGVASGPGNLSSWPTRFTWTGGVPATDEAVIEIQSCVGCSFKRFIVSGEGENFTTGIFRWASNNALSENISEIKVDHVYLSNPSSNGTPVDGNGVGMLLRGRNAGGTNDQFDQMDLRFKCHFVDQCLVVDSVQATNIAGSVACNSAISECVRLTHGQIIEPFHVSSTTATSWTASSNLNHVYIDNTFGPANLYVAIENNQTASQGVVIEAGAHESFRKISGRITNQIDALDFIEADGVDYELSLTDLELHVANTGHTGNVKIEPASGEVILNLENVAPRAFDESRDTSVVSWTLASGVTSGNGSGVVQSATFDTATVTCDIATENCSNMIQIEIDNTAPTAPGTAGLCNFGVWDNAGTETLSVHCNGGIRVDF